MIWIIKEDESHQIISCNTIITKEISELWITRPNGKGMKIFESKNSLDVLELKEAIDYAIEHDIRVFKIK